MQGENPVAFAGTADFNQGWELSVRQSYCAVKLRAECEEGGGGAGHSCAAVQVYLHDERVSEREREMMRQTPIVYAENKGLKIIQVKACHQQ